ncbi:ABC transport system, permease component [Corynebacterium urealyticum DSM 7109]|uniref:ABC transport system, permease component n=1 Tax=Corynebacterium urealyticum (strain ATCC 43042 / DSM 7109) TaxID=504474 RepID=B1VG12_CORU7|nr:ABC transport system, permease component [Corynebacterium urealyticum DSM 7109]
MARTWEHVAIASLPIVLGIAILLFFSRDLNILLMGDQAARTTGVNVRRVRVFTLTLAALITASAVAVSGVIGFVGLVVPHLIRLLIGPNHKVLLPTAALAGAAFLLAADTIARMLFAPVTLQTGTVVAFIGSPIFLWLLLRGRRSVGWSA